MKYRPSRPSSWRKMALGIFFVAAVAFFVIVLTKTPPYHDSPHEKFPCYFPDPNITRIDMRGDLRSTWEGIGATFVTGITGYHSGKDNAILREEAKRIRGSPPRSLDPTLYSRHCSYFGTYVSCSEGKWKLPVRAADDDPFVAVIEKDAWAADAVLTTKDRHFVSSIVDVAGNTIALSLSLPQMRDVYCYPKLISIVAIYYTEYYHFLIETLPRLLLAKQLLDRDPESNLIIHGWRHYVHQFIELLGIPSSRLVVIFKPNNLVALQAKQMFIPKYTRIFAPPPEALLSVREAVWEGIHRKIPLIPKPKSQAIIYMVRTGRSRRAANDIKLMRELQNYVDTFNQQLGNREDLLPLEFIPFYGNLSVVATALLFNRARVIMGAHGAGHSNMLWAGSSASVIEFIFTDSIGHFGLYWELATKLGLEYWMLPVPGMAWDSPLYTIPITEVIDIIHSVLPFPSSPSTNQTHCPPGSVESSHSCVPCPPGTYHSAAFEKCIPCLPGQYNSNSGSTYCASCPIATYSPNEGSTECLACPENKEGFAHIKCKIPLTTIPQ